MTFEELNEINDRCNQITTGDTSENYGHGKCLYQSEAKIRELKTLDVPTKLMHGDIKLLLRDRNLKSLQEEV